MEGSSQARGVRLAIEGTLNRVRGRSIRPWCRTGLRTSGGGSDFGWKGTQFMRSLDELKNVFREAVGRFVVIALVLAGGMAAFLFLYPLAKYSYHYWLG
jgi:hypothetical protein